MTPITIVIMCLWIIGFTGGLSLGALLSARDNKRKCDWVWKFMLISSIIILVILLFGSSN